MKPVAVPAPVVDLAPAAPIPAATPDLIGAQSVQSMSQLIDPNDPAIMTKFTSTES